MTWQAILACPWRKKAGEERSALKSELAVARAGADDLQRRLSGAEEAAAAARQQAANSGGRASL